MLNSLNKGEISSRQEIAAGSQGGELYQRFKSLGEGLSQLTREYQNLAPVIHSASADRYVPPVVAPLNNGSSISGEELGKAARHIYRSRRKRSAYISDELFGEPAWDMLLDLFASGCEGRRISVTSACIAASVPSTTALRWITVLAQAGLVVKVDDPDDARRSFVDLTVKGHSVMTQYLQNYLGG